MGNIEPKYIEDSVSKLHIYINPIILFEKWAKRHGSFLIEFDYDISNKKKYKIGMVTKLIWFKCWRFEAIYTPIKYINTDDLSNYLYYKTDSENFLFKDKAINKMNNYIGKGNSYGEEFPFLKIIDIIKENLVYNNCLFENDFEYIENEFLAVRDYRFDGEKFFFNDFKFKKFDQTFYFKTIYLDYYFSTTTTFDIDGKSVTHTEKIFVRTYSIHLFSKNKKSLRIYSQKLDDSFAYLKKSIKFFFDNLEKLIKKIENLKEKLIILLDKYYINIISKKSLIIDDIIKSLEEKKSLDIFEIEFKFRNINLKISIHCSRSDSIFESFEKFIKETRDFEINYIINSGKKYKECRYELNDCVNNIIDSINNLISNKVFSFIDKDFYFKNFIVKKYHKNKNWKNLDIETINNTFKFGSILLAERKIGTYFHACVFLGWDLIIHVKALSPDDIKLKNSCFQFDRFENYVVNSKEIIEYINILNIYKKDEIIERAVELSNQYYEYNLYDNNCEHLAFYLTTGLKFCSQFKNFIKKFVAENMTPIIKNISSISSN